ncbi:lysozyme inhibitor LprI family protein [Solidesulfovibrio sp.]|uniref:lysozyme inhibitor LprI family protein n=1 Tax=Solidesulfovibrio sp. TaxID=2910990 RepID=UPI00260F70E8|nr:lysozyme inhibitor LprI family protein [Solidesulfovibrio sp.]
MRVPSSVLLAAFLFVSAGPALAQSQAELNAAACGAAKKADAELNAVYGAILKKNAGDKRFIDKLKAAQRAWLAFRDAEMAARYPAEDKSEYGTIFNLCWCNALASLTEARAAQLRPWRDGVPEGDACLGSYPVR